MEQSKLYNLTVDSQSFISTNPPDTFPEHDYSFVEILYNETKIIQIKGNYVTRRGEVGSECIIEGLDIGEVITEPNETNDPSELKRSYFDRLRDYIEGMGIEERKTIIKNSNLLDPLVSDDSNLTRQLQQLFIAELGSSLVYYHFMLTDQEEMEFPFHPLEIKFPFPTIDFRVLDQNMGLYFSYPYKILNNLPIDTIGKVWLEQIDNFWTTWGSLFPKKLVLDFGPIIYDSVLAFSNYVQDQTETVSEQSNQIKIQAEKSSYQIDESLENALERINGAQAKFKEGADHFALLVTSIGSMVLKTIKIESDWSVKQLNDGYEKIRTELDGKGKNTLGQIEKIANDKITTLNKTLEGVKSCIKEYSKDHVMSMSRCKKQITESLWDSVPEIIGDLDNKLCKIIDRNVKDEIERCFCETITKYKRGAEKRLEEVLEPLVRRKTEQFKEEAEIVFKKTKNHADRAREHSNRAFDLISKVDRVEERINSLEMELSQTTIQKQITGLKKDMTEIKDVLGHICKTFNIRV